MTDLPLSKLEVIELIRERINENFDCYKEYIKEENDNGVANLSSLGYLFEGCCDAIVGTLSMNNKDGEVFAKFLLAANERMLYIYDNYQKEPTKDEA